MYLCVLYLIIISVYIHYEFKMNMNGTLLNESSTLPTNNSMENVVDIQENSVQQKNCETSESRRTSGICS